MQQLKNKLIESLRVGHHIYETINVDGSTIYAGKDGILGVNDVHIPWDMIKTLYTKAIIKSDMYRTNDKQQKANY